MKQPTHFFNLEAKKNIDGSRLIYFNLNYGMKEFDITIKKLSIVKPLPLAVMVTSLFSLCEIPIVDTNRIKNRVVIDFNFLIFRL